MKNFLSSVLPLFLAFALFADDLETARAALRDGMWRLAIEKASAAESAATDDAIRTAARQAVVEALVKDGRPREAFERIESYANTSEEPENDAMRYTRAWVLSLLGRDAEALEAIGAPLEDAVWAGRADVLAGRLLAGAGDLAGARKRLERLLSTPGAEGDEARFITAGIDARENPDAFPRLYDEIYNEGKDAADAVFAETALVVSERKWSTGETNAAIAAARAAIDRAPSAEVKLRARAVLARKEIHVPSLRRRAMESIREIVNENPDSTEALLSQVALADALLAAGQAAEAAEEYRRALELHEVGETDARALEGNAWALKALGRHAEAAAQFAAAARHHKAKADQARAIFAKADSLAESRLFAEAAKCYLQAAEKHPAGYGAKGRFAGARALAEAGETARAAQIWQALADEDPAAEGYDRLWSAESHLALAVLDEKANRAESAAAHAAAVLSQTNLPVRLEARALAERARAFYQAYRFADAATDFTAAAKLEPERAEKTQFLLALCRFGEGRDKEARAEAERLAAKTADPALKRSVLRWLARLDYNTGDFAAAANRFAECAQTSQHPEDSLWAARSAFAGTEFLKAVEFATKAIETAGSKGSIVSAARMVQGEALIELARYDEAVDVLDSALVQTAEVDTQRRIAILRADALFAMGADNAERWKEALEAYRKALSTGEPSDAAKLEISFKIARSLEKLNLADEAAREYYLNVVLAYVEAREKGVWFDKQSRSFFSRAAFALADHHEARGDNHQAAQILKLLAKNSSTSAAEARRRLANLRRKGRIL